MLYGRLLFSQISLNTHTSLISANFTRTYRARAAFATVPPIRNHLVGRAMAPKTISPTRISVGTDALRSNLVVGKRGKRTTHTSSASASLPDPDVFEMDVALIPIPVSSKYFLPAFRLNYFSYSSARWPLSLQYPKIFGFSTWSVIESS
jgi:hypothetical protein